MSFFDDASLVFLPSGQAGKDGKAYSMKPTNGDGDFTFSRGSNLTATRIDSNGLIAKGRENLLLQSNQFDTTWTTNEASVTSGQSGYDGSSDAWLLEADSDGNGRRVQQSKTQSGVSTLSIYAKAGTTDWLRIEFGGAASLVYFDLTNGVLGSETNAIGKIESVGNGWYRCSAVNTSGSTPTTMRCHLASDNNNIAVVTGDNIYIQDGQLEQGLVATEYIESGASTGLAGILEDSPRFDYSGGASCPSLLLEGSRTNLIEFSEYLEGTNWGVGGSTGLELRTSITSPDGNNGVYLVTSEAENTSSRVQYNLGSLGNDHIFSVFIKGTGSATRIRLRNNTASVNAVEYNIDSSGNFTLHSQSALDGYYGADDYGNGWHRVYLKVDTDGGGNNFMQIYSDVVDADGSMYVWGVQAEDASYITSYIPNHSGGSVTREFDDLSDLDISSMITSSSFTWFLDLNDYIGSDINQEFILLESSPNLKIELRVRPDGYRFYYNNIAGGSTYPIAGSTTANKFCVSYDGNDYRLYVDGTLEATTRSVGDSGWDFIKNVTGASLPLKQMLLFPSKLSDPECITITS